MPSTVCLKSIVTVLDDRITKGKSSANRFQAWQVDHERARQPFFKTNQDNEDKFRADLGQMKTIQAQCNFAVNKCI